MVAAETVRAPLADKCTTEAAVVHGLHCLVVRRLAESYSIRASLVLSYVILGQKRFRCLYRKRKAFRPETAGKSKRCQKVLDGVIFTTLLWSGLLCLVAE